MTALPSKSIETLWEQIAPEDRPLCLQDEMLYGNVFLERGDDGWLHRVDQSEALIRILNGGEL